MTAPHSYIPDGPIETAPYLGHCPPEVRQEAFGAVLDGVETGAYDRRIIAWLTQWDDTTCRTIASLMWRCRLAGGGDDESAPAGHRPSQRTPAAKGITPAAPAAGPRTGGRNPGRDPDDRIPVKKKATMTEITLRPGQEPEPRPGPWPQQQDILYCENTGCLIRRRQRPAAVTLAGIWSGALTLSCDECARMQYNHLPGSYRVLPLSEYRDWYAEARSQMQDTVAVVTAEVIDDGSVRAAAPSPAPVAPQAAAISARGPAPAPAAAASGPPPGGSPGAPAAGPGKKMSRPAARTLLGAGIAVTACVAFGVFLITWGNHLAWQDGTYSNAPWSFWARLLHADAANPGSERRLRERIKAESALAHAGHWQGRLAWGLAPAGSGPA